MLRAPLISEKTARLQETNQYVFEVAQGATKADVKAAVEQLFNVQVETVNVVNLKGKTKAFRSENRYSRQQAQGICTSWRRSIHRRDGQGLR